MTASPPRRVRALTIGAASVALCATSLTMPALADEGPSRDERLDASLAAVPDAGLPGALAAASVGDDRWTGAAGVADLRTEGPTRPEMRHRVASVTKTFVSVGVLQQVAEGNVELDAPVGRYLPAGPLPAELADAVTVRMLLNHTSGIGDYVVPAFPSLAENSGHSLDEHRFRQIAPEELVALGLSAPATGVPGERHSYSNTNYILAGLLLGEVTGVPAERYITERVIEPAGLRDTAFPESPVIRAPHPRMYTSLHGLLERPRDYSVYDMSWAGTAGSLVTTMADLNTFQAALFGGELLPDEQLAEMLETVPVEDLDGDVIGAYGLGVYPVNLSCGTFWGHDGVAWGASTLAFSSPDGESQAAIGYNASHYGIPAEDGTLEPHPADLAVILHLDEALCGAEREAPPEPTAAPLRDGQLPLLIDQLATRPD
ncbi:serine hydrolase domain-containing protein [Streptomyces profundus]|uniref:serine hydrolase domain-containing protein n=1 Tax=Streptomyces profundus TaxID=2867410 RepID=UPI001D15E6BE|nr:serine hydrolase domain-containing protein [Streptomyces sp. MA3_2.13]UED87278.1 beta-lactamase family protein [Streptomyces sp. MA3_2.13]